MRTLIQKGTLVTEQGMAKADLLIENGKVATVGENLTAQAEEVIDASGKLIFPGFIDAHTHMDLFVGGRFTADDFDSGTKAAVLGGTTCLVDFATQEKEERLQDGLDHWNEKAQGKSHCDYAFHMAISEWREDVKAELPNMFEAGITSFKLYMTYGNQVNDREIFEILTALKPLGGIVGVHCENSGIIDGVTAQLKAQGITDPVGHPVSRPDEAEAEAVHRLLTIARIVDVPVIIVHLSSAKGLEEVRRARAMGQKVFVETCPHYLLLDDSEYARPDFEGAKYVCSPPLRKKADQSALWQGLQQGEIQTISTDHCSFTMEQKREGEGNFSAIAGGMPGVQERVRLMLTYGQEGEKLSLPRLVELMAANPAKLYGMYPQKGTLQVGSDADVVIWAPDAVDTLTGATSATKAGYNPYEGWKVQGKPETVLLRGEKVVEAGELIRPYTGQYVKRGSYQL